MSGVVGDMEDDEGERRRDDEPLRTTCGVSHRIDHMHFNSLHQPMTSLTAISTVKPYT